MEVVLSGDMGELQRALNHAERRVAESVHDAVGKRTVVRADADGALEALAFEHERREFFLDALQLFHVLRVGVFLDGKFFGVGVVAGVHADDFHPLHSFHRGFRLEMDVGHDGHGAAAFAEFGDDDLQVRRVLHGRGGDAHDLATDGDEIERLLHTGGGVHRVTGDHGLHDNGAVAADDDAAVGGVADNDFAGDAAVMEEGGFAVFHGWAGATAGAGGLVSGCSMVISRLNMDLKSGMRFRSKNVT